MRTDSQSDRSPSLGGTVSRRGLVLASGTALGAAVWGTAGVGTATVDRAVGVAATTPYRPAVRRAADHADAPVEVRPVDDAGDASVLVSGRPVVDGDAPDGVTIDGLATLVHPDGEWREPLSRSAVRDRWSGADPVATWSETRWDAFDDATDRADAAEPANERDDDASVTALVRGTRAYQYARGHGGVGYAAVAPDAIAPLTAETGTPIARLGFVHVDSTATTDDDRTAFLASYGRRSPESVAAFVDPVVE